MCWPMQESRRHTGLRSELSRPGLRNHGLCQCEQLRGAHSRSGFRRDPRCHHGEKPSVVQIRAEDVSPDAIGKQIVIALRQMASELEEGALLMVDPNRTRLRLLPLQPRG